MLNRLLIVSLFLGFFFGGNVFSQDNSMDYSELMDLMGNVDPVVLKGEYASLNRKANLAIKEQAILASMALGIAQQELNNIDMAKHAFDILEELTESNDNPILLAMLGTSEALIGRDSSNVFTKTRSTKKGIKKLNDAAEDANTPLERTYVHFLSAQVFTAVPTFFKASKSAPSALKASIDAFKELDSNTQKELVGYLAVIYSLSAQHEEKAGNVKAANQYWEKIIEIAPNSYSAEKAKNKLNK